MEQLSLEETRIIGSLIEKEHATPDYYPMTINALVNACNQKSSRNPVVSYNEELVESIVIQLRDKQLVSKVTGTNNRVFKYSENFTRFYNLTKPQTAVLCILFLRGAQTVGEIRSRSSRIYDFNDLGEVHKTIDELIEKEENPYIVKLPKDSGREHRYTHLFCGIPDIETKIEKKENLEDKVLQLEEEVSLLKQSLSELQNNFLEFKKVFD